MKIKRRHVKMARAAWRCYKRDLGKLSYKEMLSLEWPIYVWRWYAAARGK